MKGKEPGKESTHQKEDQKLQHVRKQKFKRQKQKDDFLFTDEEQQSRCYLTFKKL